MLTSTTGSAFYGCAGILVVLIVVVLIPVIASGNLSAIALVVLLALGVFGAIGYGAREVSRWDDLQIVLAQWPLALGGTQTVELVQRAKVSVPNRELPVNGDVLCREKVKYQVGTDTRTENRDVYQRSFSVTGTIQDGVFRAAIPLHIPIDAGGPTIDFEHNEINWRITFDLSELSRLSSKQSFGLVVAPFLDSISPAIQDSPRPPS